MGGVDVATELADGFARAWNRHDMEESGELFHGDADFVNVLRGIREALKERQPASRWADPIEIIDHVQVIRPLADSPGARLEDVSNSRSD